MSTRSWRRRAGYRPSIARTAQTSLATVVALAALLVGPSVAGAVIISAPSSAAFGATVGVSASDLPLCWDPLATPTYSWTFAGATQTTADGPTPSLTVARAHSVDIGVQVTGTPPALDPTCPAVVTAQQSMAVDDRAPSFGPGAITPATAIQNVQTTFGRPNATDPDGDPLTYRWDFGNGEQISNKFSFPDTGAQPVSVIVRDGQGGSATLSGTVTVSAPVPPNHAPTCSDIIVATSALAPHQLHLVAQCQDQDPGTTLTYTWSFNPPPTAATGGGTAIDATFGPGAHAVTVTAGDGQLSGGRTETVSTPDAAPTAQFDATPTTVVLGGSVAFDGTTSQDPDGDPIVAYTWTFGDGATATGATTTHAFASLGTQSVTLTVDDGYGATNTHTSFVNVVAQTPPTPSFTFAPTAPQTGQGITFTSTATPGAVPITGYLWDLDGDGAYDDAAGPTAQWTFTTPGTHTVRLKIMDANFAEPAAPTTFQRVVVTAPPAVIAPGVTPPPTPPPTPHAPVVGASAKPMLQPFPIVRIIGRAVGSGVRLSLLSVRAPAGAMIRVTCTGRGCPPRSLRATVRAGHPGVSLSAMRRRLSRGATIEIYVTKPGFVGKFTRFRIRGGRAPARRDACVTTPFSKPVPCPSG
jgi:PKD repeat protein